MIEILIIVNGERHYLTGSGVSPISLQFNISDVNDITSSNSSYSKTIKLPDNKNNREVFGFIQNLNSSGSILNPNKKIKAYILVDSVVALEGYIRMMKITPDLRSNNSYYECIIYGDNANFGVAIADKFITDDDYSEYDHLYATSSIISSWGNSYDSGYFYPLIDSGSNWEYKEINGSTYSIKTGDRWITYYNQLQVRDFKTAVYVKTIWDKIFSSVGFTYKSEFLNSSKFKNLLIPFNGSVMPTSKRFIYNNSFAVGLLGTFSSLILDTPVVSNGPNIGFTSSIAHSIKFDNKFPPYSDPLGAFQTGYSATGSYWKNLTGINLQTGFVLDFDADFEFSSPIPKDSNNQILVGPSFSTSNQFGTKPLYKDYQDYIQIFRSMNPITGTTDPYFDQDGKQQFACPIFNGSTKMDLWSPQCIRTILGTVSSNGYTQNKTNFRLVRYTTGILNGGSGTQSNTQLIGARPNEKFKVVLTRTYGGMAGLTGFRTVTSITTIKPTTYLALNIDPAVFPGVSVDFNGVLPKNMKKKDFISNIKNMFNLYFEKSKDIDNCLIIEPRDDYYATGESEDWVSKLDESQPIKESIIAETQNKYTNFTYKIDSDYYNQDYFQKTGNVFGQFNYIMDNDFLTDTKKVELMFSPTPMMNIIGSPDIIIPQIVKVNGNGSSTDGVGTHFDFNTRILTRGDSGTVSTAGSQIMLAGTLMKYYPYAGHLDHPITPTYDINFGEVTNIYNGGAFGWGSYSIGLTSDTLFNTYYSRMLGEYSNPGSRLISCSMILNVNDINKFRFNKKIYLKIDGAYGYYRVLKISGWDPTNPNKPCQVDLLKAIYTNQIKNKNSDTGSIYDGSSTYSVPEQTPPIYIPTDPPILNGFVTGNNNTLKSKDSVVIGSNNFMGSSGIVIGSDHIVNSNNSIIGGIGNFIQNSSNIITFGEGNDISNNNNSLVIGSSNQILNGSNVILGSDNIIGTESSNTIIIGSGFSTTQSNSIFIGGSGSSVIISGSVSQDNIRVGVNEVAFGDGIGGLTSSNDFTFIGVTTSLGAPFSTLQLGNIGIGGCNGSLRLADNSGGTWTLISGYDGGFVVADSNDNVKFRFQSAAYSSFIQGGFDDNLVIGNTTNGIGNTSSYNTIIGGQFNNLGTSSNSSIIGGNQNNVGNSNNSGIFGGYCNNILPSSYGGSGFDSNFITSNKGGIFGFCLKNNIISGGYNSIIGSESNVSTQYNYSNGIFSSSDSIIGQCGVFNINNVIIGGKCNSTNYRYNVIIGGCNNKTSTAKCSSIINGTDNCLQGNVYNSSIIGGKLNKINNTLPLLSCHSIIVGGNQNQISSSEKSVIIGGATNSITSSTSSVIIGGSTNILNDSQQSSIIGGQSNQIGTSSNSGIFGGCGNILAKMNNSNISSGYNNCIISNGNYNGTGNTINGGTNNKIVNNYVYGYTNNNSIVGGQNNILGDDNYTISNSILVGGVGNRIHNTYASIILGGDTNEIYQSGKSIISGGSNNIVNNSPSSILLGGSNNIVNNSLESSIISGKLNTMTSSNYSLIGSGRINKISNSSYSFISGCGSCIELSKSSIIFGSSNTIRTNVYVNDSNFISGISNRIVSATSSGLGMDSNSILGGHCNTIMNSVYNGSKTVDSVILSGRNNTLLDVTYSSIIGGFGNFINDYNTSIYGGTKNTIVGGSLNSIRFGCNNIIINGGGSCMYNSNYSSIIGSSGNVFNSSGSGVVSSNGSQICTSSDSFISGGSGHVIKNANSSVIIGSNDHKVYSSNSVILGGSSNTISGTFSGLVIIGAGNKTLSNSISNKNFTTLVQNFILTGSMSTINGSTYSVGWNGTASFGAQVGTFVNGILINIV